jgi:hypothetical protein
MRRLGNSAAVRWAGSPVSQSWQHLFTRGPDRREGPQGVVEVEGDGADREAHPAL